MFNDISISNMLMEDFRNINSASVRMNSLQRWTQSLTNFVYSSAQISLFNGVDLSVRVLTAGFWPIHNPQTCTLPTVAQNAYDAFRNFYLAKYSGRKLTLQPGLGSVDLSAVFYGSRCDEAEGKDKAYVEFHFQLALTWLVSFL